MSCAICLNDYNKATISYTVTCGHFFHKTCIDTWQSYNTTCPLCRQKIVFNPFKSGISLYRYKPKTNYAIINLDKSTSRLNFVYFNKLNELKIPSHETYFICKINTDFDITANHIKIYNNILPLYRKLEYITGHKYKYNPFLPINENKKLLFFNTNNKRTIVPKRQKYKMIGLVFKVIKKHNKPIIIPVQIKYKLLITSIQ